MSAWVVSWLRGLGRWEVTIDQSCAISNGYVYAVIILHRINNTQQSLFGLLHHQKLAWYSWLGEFVPFLEKLYWCFHARYSLVSIWNRQLVSIGVIWYKYVFSDWIIFGDIIIFHHFIMLIHYITADNLDSKFHRSNSFSLTFWCKNQIPGLKPIKMIYYMIWFTGKTASLTTGNPYYVIYYIIFLHIM